MKTLPDKFEEINTKNESLSTYVNFVRTIGKGKYSKTDIVKWFNKLVDKDDYSRSDKKALLNNLIKLAKIIKKKSSVRKA